MQETERSQAVVGGDDDGSGNTVCTAAADPGTGRARG